MNVALTHFCNQKCLFCFGADAMNMNKPRAATREISLNSLRKIMDFMKRSAVFQFNMIGGEPTLHSKFEDIYDRISKRGFSVMIFSNGVIDKEKVDFLSKKGNLQNILLNIRHPEEYSKEAWGKISHTLLRLSKKITLSFRIYKLGFDLRFLFDLIDQYKLMRSINLAIACPSLANSNVYIKLEDHEKIAQRMVEFSIISKKRGISWYSDSGFIFCAFNNGKLKALKNNVGFVPTVNCSAAVEVAPDLGVSRCFGLASKSRPELRITDFANLAEAEKYFLINSLPFKRMGGMDKCFKCEHIISQKCGGGCMAHILKKIPNYKNLPAFF